MKKSLKICLVAIIGIVSLFTGLVFSRTQTAQAQSNSQWYYDTLQSQEKVFYDAFVSSYSDQTLMTGTAVIDITDENVVSNTLSQDEIKSYALNGDNSLMASFNKAKLAFKYDNAQSTFIDFDKLSLTVGTKPQGEGVVYTAIISSGKHSNYYASGYTSREQVLEVIRQTKLKINEIVSQISTSYSAELKIREVHQLLVKTIKKTYAYQTNQSDISNFVNSPYGALVLNKANDEGYARAFKMILDYLNINNVLVFGTHQSIDTLVYNSVFNYVNLSGNWYAVCCACDDIDDTLILENNLLAGSNSFFIKHKPDTQNLFLSSPLIFPRLSTTSYQRETGFEIESLIGIESKYPFTRYSRFVVSFDGKNLQSLKNAGLYVVVRQQYLDVSDQIVWSDWFMINKYLNAPSTSTCKDGDKNFEFGGGHYSTQFAVTKINITELEGYNFINSDNTGDNAYNYNKLSVFDEESCLLYISNPIAGMLKDRETTKPILQSLLPSNANYLMQDVTYNIVADYDEILILKQGYTENSINVVVKCSNPQALTNTIVSNIKWDLNNKVSFNFRPSPLYIDNKCTYTFSIEGLIGLYSGISPNKFQYNVFQTPTSANRAVDVQDLYYFTSPVAVKDASLTFTSDNEIKSSQDNLVLTNTRLSGFEIGAIDSLIKTQQNISDDVEIIGYNLNLTLDGNDVTVNKDMKIVFDYPELCKNNSYTYLLYFFKMQEDGSFSIQTKDIVATNYGLVTTTKEFGVFAIVVQNKQPATKNIISFTDQYGSITDEGVKSINSGSNLNYTITTQSGYQIQSISLNNVLLPLNEQSTPYNLEIANNNLDYYNELNVQFVSNQSKQQMEDLQVTPVLERKYNQTPIIVVQPESIEVAKGNTLILSVQAYNNSNANLSYQWYKDGEKIQGATSNSYTTKVVDQTQGNYYVEITSELSGNSIVVKSQQANVTLNNYAVIYFLVAFFAAVLILSVFVLIMNKKYKIPEPKQD